MIHRPNTLFRRVRADHRFDERGFTLIELLVVIIILGILSAVVVFAVRGAGDKGKVAALTTDDKTVRTAEESYCAKFGTYGTMTQLVDQKFLSDKSSLTDVLLEGGGPCGQGVGSSFKLYPTPPPVKYPLTVTACGLPITISHSPTKVVVDDTAVAEMMFALGVGDRMISQFMATNLVDALPQYKDRDALVPSLGGPRSSRHAPSRDVLLAAGPDLVIPSFRGSLDTPEEGDPAPGKATRADLASIGAVGVKLSYGCPAGSNGLKIENQLNDLLLMGEIFGLKDRAQTLVDAMHAQLADVDLRVANLPKPPVATFYFFNNRLSTFVGGVPDELVQRAGGTNVWTGTPPSSPGGDAIISMSNEQFASKPADFFSITNLSGISQGQPSVQTVFDGFLTTTFPSMPAVVNKKYTSINGHAQQPSLVTVVAVIQLAKLLHPDAFPASYP